MAGERPPQPAGHRCAPAPPWPPPSSWALTLASAAPRCVTLLRRSLVANLDDVAEVRADDVAALARDGRAARHPRLVDEDAVVQVVDAGGRVVAASPTSATTRRSLGRSPAG